MSGFWLMVVGAVVAWLATAWARALRDCEAPILWCLRHEPGMLGLDIAEVTGISRSVIYYHLGNLEEAGKVRRVEEENVRVPKGARRFRYYLVQETNVR
jgi:predicted transcriptional regulator